LRDAATGVATHGVGSQFVCTFVPRLCLPVVVTIPRFWRNKHGTWRRRVRPFEFEFEI